MLNVFIPVFGNDFSFLASTFAGSLTSGAFCPKSTPGVEGWVVRSLAKSNAGTSWIAGLFSNKVFNASSKSFNLFANPSM